MQRKIDCRQLIMNVCTFTNKLRVFKLVFAGYAETKDLVSIGDKNARYYQVTVYFTIVLF